MLKPGDRVIAVASAAYINPGDIGVVVSNSDAAKFWEAKDVYQHKDAIAAGEYEADGVSKVWVKGFHEDYIFTQKIGEQVAKVKTVKKCVCAMGDIMLHGCKCGGV